jgi:hypothetical protein
MEKKDMEIKVSSARVLKWTMLLDCLRAKAASAWVQK